MLPVLRISPGPGLILLDAGFFHRYWSYYWRCFFGFRLIDADISCAGREIHDRRKDAAVRKNIQEFEERSFPRLVRPFMRCRSKRAFRGGERSCCSAARYMGAMVYTVAYEHITSDLHYHHVKSYRFQTLQVQP